MSWTLEEIAAVEAAVRPPGKNARARRLPASPHGVLANGRQDFQRYPLKRFSGVIINSADFSHARSPKSDYGVDGFIQLSWVVANDTCFDYCGTFDSINGTFQNCTFRKIQASRSGISGTFENCDFTDANLRRATLAANFRECRFDGANMLVNCWGASFRNCTFADAKIDDVFAEIRDFVRGGAPVTFSMLTSGKLHPGVAVHIS